jgi:hypothetical protein
VAVDIRHRVANVANGRQDVFFTGRDREVRRALPPGGAIG